MIDGAQIEACTVSHMQTLITALERAFTVRYVTLENVADVETELPVLSFLQTHRQQFVKSYCK